MRRKYGRERNGETSVLPPLLEEFRAALLDEIEVAKRNSSSSAISLTNGHKVASLGSAHQYAFLIDSVLNMPDGAPGDLMVPGKAPMAATMVSAEGLRMVVSVETNLGHFVPTAKLQTDLTILMRKLIERIEDNANQQNLAAERMLGNAKVSGDPEKPIPQPQQLNRNQLSALESALGRDLTVIWGPPGTGKTHTIGTITEHLNQASRTVLLVSHTNSAVDQAIKYVANSMQNQLAEGSVVRVGVVKDKELAERFPDVLLKNQVEHQSRELVDEKEHLSAQKQELGDELAGAQKSVEIIEWLETTKQDMAAIGEAITGRDYYRQIEWEASQELDTLRRQHWHLLEMRELAATALRLRKLLETKQKESIDLQGQFSTLAIEKETMTAAIGKQNCRIEIAIRIAPVREERTSLPSQNEQKATIAAISEKLRGTKNKLTIAQKKSADAQALLKETLGVGALRRMLKRLPKPEDQRTVANSYANRVSALDVELLATQQAKEAAIRKLARIIEVDGELARHADIGTYPQELEVKIQAERKLEETLAKTSETDSLWTELQRDIRQLEEEFAKAAGKIDGDIKAVYLDSREKLQKLKQLDEVMRQAGQSAAEMQSKADSLLSRSRATLQQWIGFEEPPSSAEECFAEIHAWHTRLADEYTSMDLDALRDKIDGLRIEILTLDGRITEVDAKLSEVEREVINKAAVLGATLTKAYLSDDIQARKFDTVILDEASMAPIPALWAATLLAEKNLVLVGDFKQLPPIVLSNNDLTKKWLGRDIFEASGMKAKWIKKETPPYFIPLLQQRRMLPEIAEVANLFYDSQLDNAFTAPEQYRDYESFKHWYVKDWKYDNPIVLVDTAPLNAWVTSVVKHGNSSRLNFLSATVAVDIAEQLLSPDRPSREEGAPKRILIVSPYRAHAKLVTVLLKDFAGLQNEVVAGTAHSFQGSEADVVIFDTVIDEPHFRANLFMPSLDEDLKCLLNVALTRAKFRLFILADFDYCLKQGPKAFLGKTLIPTLLKNFPRVDARDIVPEGLAARAAKAQMTAMGGKIDLDSERIVVTQEDFYRILSSDTETASSRIIIYSPFITTDRVSFLLPQLQAAIERGVNVYVITKALSERSQSELPTIKKIEEQLVAIGIAVIHKLRMHEKLVFIDDDVTWSGSLNPLSFSNTQEIMERRKSKAVLKDYFQILRLHELISAHGKPDGVCPICGGEMIAAEGADQPYYWRCVNNQCFTRAVDQPHPIDGVLKCSNCNSTVKFGYWGDYPHWRCVSNNRHRQKIFKSHLKLPKMAALVPRSAQGALCKLFNIESFDDYVRDSQPIKDMEQGQLRLFD
ncbi:MAG: AAA family ATPase [Lentisphaerae bacterium]|nr:AAA family ATPase [Lentisphaerota bacterium]